MTSSIYPWVFNCTFKQQAVLLSALRGCDGIQKEDISKKFTREFRGVLLKSADPNSKYMQGVTTDDDERKFLNNLDPYPMHWLLHFLHAIEIVGYKHPDVSVSSKWIKLYWKMVEALHLRPEPEYALDLRLADIPDMTSDTDYYHTS